MEPPLDRSMDQSIDNGHTHVGNDGHGTNTTTLEMLIRDTERILSNVDDDPLLRDDEINTNSAALDESSIIMSPSQTPALNRRGGVNGSGGSNSALRSRQRSIVGAASQLPSVRPVPIGSFGPSASGGGGASSSSSLTMLETSPVSYPSRNNPIEDTFALTPAPSSSDRTVTTTEPSATSSATMVSRSSTIASPPARTTLAPPDTPFPMSTATTTTRTATSVSTNDIIMMESKRMITTTTISRSSSMSPIDSIATPMTTTPSPRALSPTSAPIPSSSPSPTSASTASATLATMGMETPARSLPSNSSPHNNNTNKTTNDNNNHTSNNGSSFGSSDPTLTPVFTKMRLDIDQQFGHRSQSPLLPPSSSNTTITTTRVPSRASPSQSSIGAAPSLSLADQQMRSSPQGVGITVSSHQNDSPGRPLDMTTTTIVMDAPPTLGDAVATSNRSNIGGHTVRSAPVTPITTTTNNVVPGSSGTRQNRATQWEERPTSPTATTMVAHETKHDHHNNDGFDGNDDLGIATESWSSNAVISTELDDGIDKFDQLLEQPQHPPVNAPLSANGTAFPNGDNANDNGNGSNGNDDDMDNDLDISIDFRQLEQQVRERIRTQVERIHGSPLKSIPTATTSSTTTSTRSPARLRPPNNDSEPSAIQRPTPSFTLASGPIAASRLQQQQQPVSPFPLPLPQPSPPRQDEDDEARAARLEREIEAEIGLVRRERQAADGAEDAHQRWQRMQHVVEQHVTAEMMAREQQQQQQQQLQDQQDRRDEAIIDREQVHGVAGIALRNGPVPRRSPQKTPVPVDQNPTTAGALSSTRDPNFDFDLSRMLATPVPGIASSTGGLSSSAPRASSITTTASVSSSSASSPVQSAYTPSANARRTLDQRIASGSSLTSDTFTRTVTSSSTTSIGGSHVASIPPSDDSWHAVNAALKRHGYTPIMVGCDPSWLPSSMTSHAVRTLGDLLNEYETRGRHMQGLALESGRVHDTNVAQQREADVRDDMITRLQRELTDAKRNTIDAQQRMDAMSRTHQATVKGLEQKYAKMAQKLTQATHVARAKEVRVEELTTKLSTLLRKQETSITSASSSFSPQRFNDGDVKEFQSIHGGRTPKPTSRSDQASVALIQHFSQQRERYLSEIHHLRSEVHKLNDEVRDRENANASMRRSMADMQQAVTETIAQRQPSHAPSTWERWESEEVRRIKDECNNQIVELTERLTQTTHQLQQYVSRSQQLEQVTSEQKTELDSRPSMAEWRQCRQLIFRLKAKLKATDSVGEIRQFVDTQSLIRRDREAHRLGLDRLELPLETCLDMIHELCRLLELTDASLVVPSVRRMIKFVVAVPGLQKFVRDVATIVTASPSTSSHIDGKSLIASGENATSVGDAHRLMDQLLPTLREWQSKVRSYPTLEQVHARVVAELRHRRSMKMATPTPTGSAANVARDLSNPNVLLEELSEMIRSEAKLSDVNSKEVSRVAHFVSHFQSLFKVTDVNQAFTKVDEVATTIANADKHLAVC
jgi:hypothetical protein